MTIEIVNPWTGQVDYRYAMMDGAAIEAKLAAAERAFPAWSGLTLDERAAVLNTVARALRAGREAIAGSTRHFPIRRRRWRRRWSRGTR